MIHPRARRVGGRASVGVIGLCAALALLPLPLSAQYAGGARVAISAPAPAPAVDAIGDHSSPTHDALHARSAPTGRVRRTMLGVLIGGLVGGAIGYGVTSSGCADCDDPAPVVVGTLGGTVIGAIVGGITGARWKPH